MSVALFILVVAVSFIVVRITSVLCRTLLRKHVLESLSIEEPVMTAGRAGILRIVLGERNPWVGRTISESTADHLRILALESDGEITLDPPGDIRLVAGDSLLCFGPLTEIRTRILKGL